MQNFIIIFLIAILIFNYYNKKKQEKELRKIYLLIVNRYFKVLSVSNKDTYLVEKASKEHIVNMLEYIITDEKMPLDKISRWIGFIQGVLVVNGFINVEEERDFTRPLFQSFYKKHNLSTKSVSA